MGELSRNSCIKLSIFSIMREAKNNRKKLTQF